MPAGAEELARRWLRDGGVRVVVGVKDSAVTTVDQSLLFTGSESGKLLALRNMVAEGGVPYPSLIFVQSIERADELSKALVLDGVRAEAVHSGRGKSKRDEAIAAFREGSVWVLVVTEVLARGMDFRGVKVVINYGMFIHIVQADTRLPTNCAELHPSHWTNRSRWSTREGYNFFLKGGRAVSSDHRERAAS